MAALEAARLLLTADMVYLRSLNAVVTALSLLQGAVEQREERRSEILRGEIVLTVPLPASD